MELIVISLVVILGAAFVGVLILIIANHIPNSLGGWRMLADHYAYDGDLPSSRRRFQSGMFYYYRLFPVLYWWTLNVAVDRDALYLWLFKPFGVFDKKLRIPFEDITEMGDINDYEMFVFNHPKYMRFRTKRAPNVKICFEDKTVKWIETTWAAMKDNESS